MDDRAVAPQPVAPGQHGIDRVALRRAALEDRAADGERGAAHSGPTTRPPQPVPVK
ncbi:MAG: hypothetical protein M5U01_09460 [Ardenticatenaceae bacterium]|nr:hypothetical protein [Ardenticatenaceae bacterium]